MSASILIRVHPCPSVVSLISISTAGFGTQEAIFQPPWRNVEKGKSALAQLFERAARLLQPVAGCDQPMMKFDQQLVDAASQFGQLWNHFVFGAFDVQL